MVVDHKRERVVRAHDGYGKEALDLFFRQPSAPGSPSAL
ncbi:MAG: hypothetical protein ACLR82_01960 [Bifidobacterium longum]